MGCFENGTTEEQFTFDAEEVLYVDFRKQAIVYTVPRYMVLDPSEVFKTFYLYKNALKNRKACSVVVKYLAEEEKNVPEEKGKEYILYVVLTSTFTSDE